MVASAGLWRRREARREKMIENSLRRQARRVAGEQRKVLQQLLNDEDALEAAVLEISNRAPDDGDDSDGGLLKVVTWFLENWEEIFALVKTIIGLFGGGGAFAMPKAASGEFEE